MSVAGKENLSKPVEPVSKVTFSPLNSEAILVSIKTVPSKPGELEELKRRSGSLDSKRRLRPRRSGDKSTMTDYKKEITVASQTSMEEKPSSSSKATFPSPPAPCLKHATQNISIKAKDIPSDQISLCNDCSQSMLSYITVVQDFLESLTKEIGDSSISEKCTQCIKEESRQQTIGWSAGAAQAKQKGKKLSIPRRKTGNSERNQTAPTFNQQSSSQEPHSDQQSSNQATHSDQSSSQPVHQDGMFIKPMERQQPDFGDNDTDKGDFHNPSSPFGEESGGHIFSLSNDEREVYDAARNSAGFETLAQERMVDGDGRILTEAFVTMCRNNAEALGCLVLGTSILLTHTKRTLCVLVSDGVSMAFREPLAAIFHLVQTVRQLDSLGTTKLALLEQPELGISFDKLNVWRLKQFHKCVYLNPDTMMIQNCDELFDREELSAVPDIGWPDCFNSGVFVYRPSERTFWQLLEFSDKQGSYDGGDQGLLNSYFKSWNSDINKKLSFIYNLMANVSYTYTPAFKKFGKDVKIVQYQGTFKPWHVKYFNVTGLISPASNVHPTYIEFVNKWIKIFKGNALRLLSQEIQAYAGSQQLISAVELLRFFPLPTESEAEFFLTPPSVRLRLAEMKLRRSSRTSEDAQRRKSAEFSLEIKSEVETSDETKDIDEKLLEEIKNLEISSSKETAGEESEDVVEDTAEKQDTLNDDISKLPGAEVGDYQGMKKWELGKMDYQGKDSSDSILKRLEYLMSQQPK